MGRSVTGRRVILSRETCATAVRLVGSKCADPTRDRLNSRAGGTKPSLWALLGPRSQDVAVLVDARALATFNRCVQRVRAPHWCGAWETCAEQQRARSPSRPRVTGAPGSWSVIRDESRTTPITNGTRTGHPLQPATPWRGSVSPPYGARTGRLRAAPHGAGRVGTGLRRRCGAVRHRGGSDPRRIGPSRCEVRPAAAAPAWVARLPPHGRATARWGPLLRRCRPLSAASAASPAPAPAP